MPYPFGYDDGVPSAGLEPAYPRLEVRCCIRFSYDGMGDWCCRLDLCRRALIIMCSWWVLNPRPARYKRAALTD
jgi:hypothetical protein